MSVKFDSFNTYNPKFNNQTGTNRINYTSTIQKNNSQNKENIDTNLLGSRNNLESYLKQGVQDPRINQLLINNIKDRDPHKQLATKRTKAVTMKIRIGSIRDRWLMNIREFDYEIYLSSAFLLILTKKKIEFIKETKMTRLVSQDAQNLLHFIE